MNQFLSSEHNRTKHGTSRGTSIRFIVMGNLANFDVIMSQGDLAIWNSNVLFFVFSPKDYRHFRTINLMFAYFNVVLIGDKNISDGNSVQPIDKGAERHNSRAHLIALITINHFGIGDHLECRFSRPKFI